MTTLYGCKRTQHHETLLIAKFDDSLVIQASYFVGPKTCQCEGFAKHKRCRHQVIRTMFMLNKHCDDGWFLDFDNRRWREYPQLAEDGTIGDFKERFDALTIGDSGYLLPAEAGRPTTPVASAAPGELVLSTPGKAPEVEQPAAPSGATLPATSTPEAVATPPKGEIVIGGIKRRMGL